MTSKHGKMTAKASGKPRSMVQRAEQLLIEFFRSNGEEIAEGGHGPGVFAFHERNKPGKVALVYVPAGMRFSQDAAGEWNMRPDAPGNWRRHPTIEGGWMYCDENGEPIDVPEDVSTHLRSLSDGWGYPTLGPRPEAIQ
jgi:hypothetical protein